MADWTATEAPKLGDIVQLADGRPYVVVDAALVRVPLRRVDGEPVRFTVAGDKF